MTNTISVGVTDIVSGMNSFGLLAVVGVTVLVGLVIRYAKKLIRF